VAEYILKNEKVC